AWERTTAAAWRTPWRWPSRMFLTMTPLRASLLNVRAMAPTPGPGQQDQGYRSRGLRSSAGSARNCCDTSSVTYGPVARYGYASRPRAGWSGPMRSTGVESARPSEQPSGPLHNRWKHADVRGWAAGSARRTAGRASSLAPGRRIQRRRIAMNRGSAKRRLRTRGSWKPGQSGNPGGRPKELGHVRDLARQHTEAAVITLVSIMNNAEEPGRARVAAAEALLNRGWGHPSQPLDLGTTDSLPLRIELRWPSGLPAGRPTPDSPE